MISRNEGRVADDSGYCHWVSTGVCKHHRGRDQGRGVSDGAALLVGGRHIHRRGEGRTENRL